MEAGITMLTQLTKTQPQNAYAALTKSLQYEWNYLQRVVPDCSTHFKSLAELLSRTFINQLVKSEGNDDERRLCAIPLQQGGLGIV